MFLGPKGVLFNLKAHFPLHYVEYLFIERLTYLWFSSFHLFFVIFTRKEMCFYWIQYMLLHNYLTAVFAFANSLVSNYDLTLLVLFMACFIAFMGVFYMGFLYYL